MLLIDIYNLHTMNLKKAILVIKVHTFNRFNKTNFSEPENVYQDLIMNIAQNVLSCEILVWKSQKKSQITITQVNQ